LSLQIKIYDIFEDPNTPINSSSIETAQNLVKSPSKLVYLYTSKDSTLALGDFEWLCGFVAKKLTH